MDPKIQELEDRILKLENGGEIPFHQHNGDMVRIEVTDLNNISMYMALMKVALTSAQILALNTTPITIVPAPGLNSAIIVEGISAKLVFNSIAYTGVNAMEFRYTDASGTKVTADMGSTFLNSGSTAYDHVAGIVTEFTPVANAPIVVRVPVANPGAGNSVITFLIKYRLISF